MSFSDIKGQPFAVKLLKRAVLSNRLAGTYLFYGPSGVGKEFTAREFAKVLNCTEKKQDSCNNCSTCTRIEKNKHPDILFVYPMGKSRQIKIEQVRQLQKFASYKAYEGRIKVGVISCAHTLNIESGNALLKTLEEPPPNTIFVLVTDSPETLLPTIRSRAQDVHFFNLTFEIVRDLLEEKMAFSKEEADYYSQLGMGSLGRALSFKDEDIFNQRKLILDILAKGGFNGMKDLMDKVTQIQDVLLQFKEKLAEKLSSKPDSEGQIDEDAFIEGEYRKQVEENLGLILGWYRDILIYKNIQNERQLLNRDYIDKIKFWSDKLEIDELLEKIKIVEDIKSALARQVNLKLLLQVMFVQLGFICIE